MIRILEFAVILLFLLTSCRNQPRLNQIELSYSEDTSFCESCPTFKVYFRSNGFVTYDCLHGCAVPGEQHYLVPPQRFAETVQVPREQHFLDIPRTGPNATADAPVFRLTYRDDRKIHEVIDAYRQNAALTKLENRFKIATEVDRFEKPSVDLYRTLLKSGWNANTVGEDRQNALTSAVAYRDLQSVRFLLQNGSAVTDTAISYAIMHDDFGLFRLLLSVSVINDENQRASNAVIGAARSKNTDLLRYLLDSGVSPNQHDTNSGLTPLLNATKNNQLANAALLLEHGARPNVGDTYGRRPLWYAANASNTGFIQLLVQHGADVNATDNYGQTALMSATSGCSYWDIEALLKAGADPTIKDKRGKAALDVNFWPEPKCQTARKLISAAVKLPAF